MKKIRGFLNAEPELYRPDDEESPAARSERLLEDRRSSHDGSSDLYAWCPRGCGRRFTGARPTLASDMGAHLEADHGAG